MKTKHRAEGDLLYSHHVARTVLNLSAVVVLRLTII